MLALIVALSLAQSPASACAFDRQALLGLAPTKFDQDLQGGWRVLAGKPGCETAAADLLSAYREAHWGKLTPGELHTNYWHEGQMRAVAGQTARAVPLLLAGVPPEGRNGFADYAVGTVAFLQRDRRGLESARTRLAGLPPPADWAKTQAAFRARFGMTMAWPPNLNVLEGLIACYDKPYREAYDSGCTKPMSSSRPLK